MEGYVPFSSTLLSSVTCCRMSGTVNHFIFVCNVKNLKIRTPDKFVVIILKVGFMTE